MGGNHNLVPKQNSGSSLSIKKSDGNVNILGEFCIYVNIVNIKLLPWVMCLSNKGVDVNYMRHFLWQSIVIGQHFLSPLSLPPHSLFSVVFL